MTAAAGGRTLDWVPQHDPKSRAYPVRQLARPPQKAVWWAGGPVLDQGSEGACTGFAAAAEAAASPVRVPGVDDAYARQWYEQARALSGMPAEVAGASVNATMKVGVERGLWESYHWAFGIDDVRAALTVGPVVIGIPWLSGMYETGPGGIVKVTGAEVGGHSLLLTGWAPAFQRSGEVFRWRNSWGKAYGRNGNGYIKALDLRKLLEQNGEAAVPTGRRLAVAGA